MPEKQRIGRREFLKLGGYGLLASVVGMMGPVACTTTISQAEAATDHFDRCVQGASGKSLLSRFVRCLPELQLQPRPVSAASLETRLGLAQTLQVELEQTPAEEVIARTFPVTVRYSAWLVAGISIELFGLVLENSTLPEVELKAWAFEHVDPHVASLDRALVPFRGLLHDPDANFSAELEAEVAEHVEELRGRLVLLGDSSLIAMAEQIRRVLAQGERLLRLRVACSSLGEAQTQAFRAQLAEDAPSDGDISWSFSATWPEWNKIVRGEMSAIDRVVHSIFTVGLLL